MIIIAVPSNAKLAKQRFYKLYKQGIPDEKGIFAWKNIRGFHGATVGTQLLCKVLCNEEHVDLYPTISYYKARHVVVLILVLVVVVVVVRQPGLIMQAMVIPIRIVVVRDVIPI